MPYIFLYIFLVMKPWFVHKRVCELRPCLSLSFPRILNRFNSFQRFSAGTVLGYCKHNWNIISNKYICSRRSEEFQGLKGRSGNANSNLSPPFLVPVMIPVDRPSGLVDHEVGIARCFPSAMCCHYLMHVRRR